MSDEKNKELEKSIFEMLFKIVRYIENLEPYSKGHASRKDSYSRMHCKSSRTILGKISTQR